MCKISVVIPVYNVERYLDECLQSVIHQTFRDIQIICIDDCSTDNSLDVIEKYQKQDERIQVIKLPENRGLSYVRNRGIDNSVGQYIYFLDSDDLIEKNTLEILFKKAEEEELDVIFFDAKIKYDDEKFVKKFETYLAIHKGSYEEIKSGIELLVDFVGNQEWISSVPRQFWSRKFIETHDLRFYEGIIHEDELFTFIALTLADRAGVEKERLFIRRFREGSIMTSAMSDKDFYGYFITYYLMNKYVIQKGLCKNAINKHLAILYGKIVRAYERLREQYDLSKGFHEQEIKNAFYFFASTQNEYMAYGCFGFEAIGEIKKYEKVYLYGAGIIARSVYESLARNDVVIEAFIVSQAEKNSKVFMGRKVIAVDKVEFENKKTLIIIAVNVKYHDEIKYILEDKNLKYITYNELENLKESKKTWRQ